MLAPIVVFVYARPDHARETIEALANNRLADQSEVFIFSDGPKNDKVAAKVDLVREYIATIPDRKLFRSATLVAAETNKGLANSVISGVSEVIARYGKIIVVEDDLVSTPDFLEYMNDALDYFAEDNRVWSICGYTFPIDFPRDYKKDAYLSYRGGSWGWATWQDRWSMVDWTVSDYPEFRANCDLRRKFNRGGRDMSDMLDAQMSGHLDSWAIRWCYAQSKLDMLTVYPRTSRIKNIGLDGSGTHSGKSSKYDAMFSLETKKCDFDDLKLDSRIVKAFSDKYRTDLQHFIYRLKKTCKTCMGW